MYAQDVVPQTMPLQCEIFASCVLSIVVACKLVQCMVCIMARDVCHNSVGWAEISCFHN